MSLMICSIEPALADDVPAMVELLADLFGIEQDFTFDCAKQEQGIRLLLQERERARILVARDEHRIVIGMVTAQLLISTAEGTLSAWIEDMVVRQGCRNQGVGRRLLEAIVNWAHDQGAVRAQLLADSDNAAALAYYVHLGWQSTHLAAQRLRLRPAESTPPGGVGKAI